MSMNRVLHLVPALLFSAAAAQGLSTESNPPLKWSATENIAWKSELPGESWSSPVVWGDRMFGTTATDGERVYAAFNDGSFVALKFDGSLA
ncbi:MAG: hypothetical protein EXS36_01480 [Pedosphaera sp.]|nr:hypothetical protein [Pedosphaera sp.]